MVGRRQLNIVNNCRKLKIIKLKIIDERYIYAVAPIVASERLRWLVEISEGTPIDREATRDVTVHGFLHFPRHQLN